ncbi:hypothetical protein GPECTOR_36g107 [Gonium pectorale]|uniref:Uncharacterized protein n=1 Tax=Gonium pectorale TaxID=33097 RepID=A0A150GBV7_GONPE|nr:hypothetical protein GPECTOR_36g107 [Gonium pectorale]|eukprot:KXZ47253.1 hypothetical protein GPECTOR_36g107 [Gonium pectorale]
MPSTYMESSETDSDEEMEDGERDEELEDAEEPESEGGDYGANSGTAPVPIPSTSEAFLKAQREALKRFVYVHQIEEMRRQCAAYFARQARFSEARPAENPDSTMPQAPTAPGIPGHSTARTRFPSFAQQAPGF